MLSWTLPPQHRHRWSEPFRFSPKPRLGTPLPPNPPSMRVVVGQLGGKLILWGGPLLFFEGFQDIVEKAEVRISIKCCCSGQLRWQISIHGETLAVDFPLLPPHVMPHQPPQFNEMLKLTTATVSGCNDSAASIKIRISI